jgi:hypothetical protein
MEVFWNIATINWLTKCGITFVGTEPHPMETRQFIRVSGHKSCASLMAKIVGLLATIAPSCHRFTSVKDMSRKQKMVMTDGQIIP